MLVAAGVFPHPPVLHPRVAGERSGELDGLRAACGEGVARLLSSQPDVLVVVGGADHTASYPAAVAGSLAAYGVDVTVGHGGGVLPLSLTVARWLLDLQGCDLAPDFESIAWDAPVEECLDLGKRVAQRANRVALMVMGDGSACRDERAPGFHAPEAVPYDDAVAKALAHGDGQALAEVEPALSARLLVSGRAAWQVLAGASGGGSLRAQLLAYQAPYGVGYFVASWQRDTR